MGYVGLGSKLIKEEDKVDVFDGAKTPFILRKVISTTDEVAWGLVGDCYVEGWTNGKYFGHKIEDNVGDVGPDSTAEELDNYQPGNDTPNEERTIKSEFFTFY
jgi:hypothetical protein